MPSEQVNPAPAKDRSVPPVSALDTFASDINAAVTTRLGPPSAERPSLIPTTGVPLFGFLGRPRIVGTGKHVENVLPPRKHADHLVGIYWEYIHPLEPLVDKRAFSRSYRDHFAGTLQDSAERIFLSTLNTILAISSQVQETMAPELREETSKTFFHRAWALLQPEAVMWESGSLELVQCLLVMSRYLQCTNHAHQTWMIAGFAVRVAQSLEIDLPRTGSVGVGQGDESTRLKQHIWNCCVFVDR